MPSLIFIFVVVCAVGLSIADDRPIVGILTLPRCSKKYDFGQCIVAGYVKFVEQAGARVVPIPYDLNQAELRDLLSKINGVLLTGGGIYLQENTPFFDALTTIYNFTLESNQKGEVFPLLGICQGFEAIASVVGGTSILKRFDARNLSLPLDFVFGGASSQLFPDSRSEWSHVYNLLATKPITFHQHSRGVSPDDFRRLLAKDFRLVAVNDDRSDKQFVSAFEGKEAPIFSLVFHPEKQIYEWPRNYNISHSSNAIFANRFFADVFVDVARKSTRSFASFTEEDQQLIYNYKPVYTGAENGYFEQIYFITPARYVPTISPA